MTTITDLVIQYRNIEEVYVDHTRPTKKGDLGNAIVSLYRNILEYQAKATCYYSLNTGKRTLINIVKRDDWPGMVEKIKDGNRECRDIMALAQYKFLDTTLDNHTQKLDKLIKEVQQQDMENEKIATGVSSFRVEKEHDNVRDKSLGRRYLSTGTWLLETERFLQWQASASGTFWLRGPIGTGKTCAVCIVIEHLLKTATSERIAFFYCSKTRHSEAFNGPQAVLGSLLAQLSYSANGKSIMPPIKEKYDSATAPRNDADLTLEECTSLLIEVTKLNQ